MDVRSGNVKINVYVRITLIRTFGICAECVSVRLDRQARFESFSTHFQR
jgi:hypothetical protein